MRIILFIVVILLLLTTAMRDGLLGIGVSPDTVAYTLFLLLLIECSVALNNRYPKGK